MFVCMFVCMHVCMYVCMYECLNVCTLRYVFLSVCMYVCASILLKEEDSPGIPPSVGALRHEGSLATSGYNWQLNAETLAAAFCIK